MIYVATKNQFDQFKLVIFSVDEKYIEWDMNTFKVTCCNIYDPEKKIHCIVGKYSDLFIPSDYVLVILKSETYTKYELISYIFKEI